MKMKCIICALLSMICLSANAQFKVYTRKARMADFPAKTTIVVLSGNELLDIALKNEISSRWRVSPFDFSDSDELASLQKNPSVYVLYMSVDESGIVFLNLEKGGDKKSFQSLNSRMDIIRVPFCARDFSTGREITYLSAMIDVIQHYMEQSLLHEGIAYTSIDNMDKTLARGRKKKIYIAREDLSEDVAGRDSLENFGKGIMISDAFTVDSLFSAASRDALIGFCISGSAPSAKGVNYQIIVSADRHNLMYYKRSKYTTKGQRGFSLKALNYIRKEHKYRNDLL